MRLIFTLCLFLISFCGFAQKVDSVIKINTKKQYLSKVIGVSNTKRLLILIDDSIYRGQMDSIDMDNVQSLNVIKKGRDAKIIYGKAAAHGAVIIKTKTNYRNQTLSNGRDLIVVDGELYTGKLTDLDPNSIFRIDVLNQQNASQLGNNIHSVVAIMTKRSAVKIYQKKLFSYSESYNTYVKDHEGDDSRVNYMLDGQSVGIDALYNLQNKNIDKVEFIPTNNYPIVKIITKQ